MDKIALIKLYVQQVRQQSASNPNSTFEAGWESGISAATGDILTFIEELQS